MSARLFVVIPAAGGGSRFGSEVPKQYALLAGKPVLARTLERLRSALDAERVVVALAADDTRYAAAIGSTEGVLALHCGAATRAGTVAKALAALSAQCRDDDWIVVHDAARPCVPVSALRRLCAALADDPVGGLLAIPVADTLKRAMAGGSSPRVLVTEERADLWQAQTPQMFRYGVLAAALSLPGALDVTDEARAVELLSATGACAMPRLVLGSTRNIKITYAADLALAAAVLTLPEEDS